MSNKQQIIFTLEILAKNVKDSGTRQGLLEVSKWINKDLFEKSDK